MAIWKFGKRCNVYLFQNEIKSISPLLEMNNGNLSKTVRDCVEFSMFAIEKIGSIKRAQEILILNNTSDLNIGDKIVLRVERVIRL